MTLAYVESSAMVKLAVREAQTSALRDALAVHERLVTSDLTAIETVRAARRSRGDVGMAHARAALLTVDLVPIDQPVVDAASRLEPIALRSLDAVHVATALAFVADDLVFYSYDARTVDAAKSVGLTVASPS